MKFRINSHNFVQHFWCLTLNNSVLSGLTLYGFWINVPLHTWSICGLSMTEIMNYPGDTQTRAVVFNTIKYWFELSIFTYQVPISQKTLRLDYKSQRPVHHTFLKVNCDISLHWINQMLCGNVECVPNYTSTYARKQGSNWTKITGMNTYQNQ